MFHTTAEESNNRPLKKLRAACDVCHQGKTKCSGEHPCAGCLQLGQRCSYSVSNRIGRPKGARNKKTLDRASRHQSSIDIGNTSDEKDTSWRGQPAVALHWQEEAWNSSMLSPANMDYGISKGTASVRTFQGNTPDGRLFATNDEDLQSFLDSLGSFTGSSSSPSRSIRTSRKPQYGYNGSVLKSQSKDGDAPNYPSVAATTGADMEPAATRGGQNSADIWGRSSWTTPVQDPSTAIAEPSIPDPFSPPLSQTCSCLQQNADLLCRLKALNTQHASPPVDILLVGANQALASWKSLLRCRNCQQNEDQEVLFLSVMSIRVILRSLQDLCLGADERNVSIEDVGMSSSPDAGTTASSSRTNSTEKHDRVRSTVGVYEVTGVERMLVTDLLISRTLGKIRVVVCRLRERSESARRNERRVSMSTRTSNISSDNDDHGTEGEIELLQQLLNSLDGTVRRLMRWLRSSINGDASDCGDLGKD